MLNCLSQFLAKIWHLKTRLKEMGPGQNRIQRSLSKVGQEGNLLLCKKKKVEKGERMRWWEGLGEMFLTVVSLLKSMSR